MAKNYLQDVVPPAQKKSIREIPVPTRARAKKKAAPTVEPVVEAVTAPKPAAPEPALDYDDYDDYGSSKGSIKKYGIIGGIVAVLVIIFFIFSSFDGATIDIKPKSETVAVDVQVETHNLAGTGAENSVGYRVIELVKESQVEVEATSEEFVQSNASGSITIYNTFDTKPQKLIANTRFESANGLIYKISESVSVPGYTEVDGQVVPGQLDAEIVAAEPGENYNTKESTFTIPGFKDYEHFDHFSAEIKSAIGGGYDGVRKIVSDDNIAAAEKELEASVTSSLIDELNGQVSEEFIAIYDASAFSFDAIEQSDAANGDNVILKLSGMITAKVFNKVDLSNAVALESVTGYTKDQNVLIEGISDLELEISNGTRAVVDTEDEEEVVETVPANIIEFIGEVTFVWQNDQMVMKEALTDKKRGDLKDVMRSFPGVQEAQVVIKPFWRTAFPENVDNIDIIIVE